MGSDTYAAEITPKILKLKTESERRVAWKEYDNWCAEAIPTLHRMNKFLYNTFRVPILASRVSLMWQFIGGLANPGYVAIGKRGFQISLDEYRLFSSSWLWGSKVDEYIKVADYAISKLDVIPISERPSEEVAADVLAFSEAVREKSQGENRFPRRWNFRNFNQELVYDEVKYELVDEMVSRCKSCGSWQPRRSDWRKCNTCGCTRSYEECEIVWEPALDEKELQLLLKYAEPKAIGEAALNWLKGKSTDEVKPTIEGFSF